MFRGREFYHFVIFFFELFNKCWDNCKEITWMQLCNDTMPASVMLELENKLRAPSQPEPCYYILLKIIFKQTSLLKIDITQPLKGPKGISICSHLLIIIVRLLDFFHFVVSTVFEFFSRVYFTIVRSPFQSPWSNIWIFI